jgi:hypothetical protein
LFLGLEDHVAALDLNRRLNIRGMVAELVPLASFHQEQTCRTSVAELGEKLWKAGFASRCWFYDTVQLEQPDFVGEVIEEKPDAIVWFMNSRKVSTLGYRLMQCGVRVIQATAAVDVISLLLS